MENHGGRPEIRDAFAKGDGQSIRYSVTIKRNLLYYAVRLSSAGAPPVVLRFALPLQTVDQAIGEFRQRLWLASIRMVFFSGTASFPLFRWFCVCAARLARVCCRV